MSFEPCDFEDEVIELEGPPLIESSIPKSCKSKQGKSVKVKQLQRDGAIPQEVVRELVCTRIGNKLFNPPVCPSYAIAKLDDTRKGFASYEVEGYHLIKLPDSLTSEEEEILKKVDPSTLADVVIFQTWLVGSDCELLVHAEHALSIDHALYLKFGELHNFEKVCPQKLLRYIPPQKMDDAIRQFEDFDEVFANEKIRKAFSLIPDEWDTTEKGMQYLAQETLKRKDQVKEIISEMRQ